MPHVPDREDGARPRQRDLDRESKDGLAIVHLAICGIVRTVESAVLDERSSQLVGFA
jgi:hypothetical protein